jgi:late competence protein required for DNA uptake (superfamily II DNA/RNA helicase)
MDLSNNDLKNYLDKSSLKNLEKNIENNNLIVNNLEVGKENNMKDDNLKKKKNRCFNCNKKLGLIPFDCRCGNLYCSKCRQAEVHNCTYDYINNGRLILEKENPKLVSKKIDKID